MPPGTSSLFHSFAVGNINTTVAVPTVRNAWNQFDEHGALMGLPRLQGEDNATFRSRIFDVFIHRANSTYRGMINGITRELGLPLSQPLLINPKMDGDGNFLASDPYIKFDGAWLYLYSDYANGLLDYKIDRYIPGGNYEHLGRLVDLVNTTSFFEASLHGNTDPFKKSMTILNQSNRVLVPRESVPASTTFRLKNDHLVSGSVLFSGTYITMREVYAVGDLSLSGAYLVDYKKGIIRTNASLPVGTSIRYEYVVHPFMPLASDVIINDINSENFRIKLFSQVLQDDGSFVDGTPTELGVDFLNELYSVYPLYWGI